MLQIESVSRIHFEIKLIRKNRTSDACNLNGFGKSRNIDNFEIPLMPPCSEKRAKQLVPVNGLRCFTGRLDTD